MGATHPGRRRPHSQQPAAFSLGRYGEAIFRVITSGITDASGPDCWPGRKLVAVAYNLSEVEILVMVATLMILLKIGFDKLERRRTRSSSTLNVSQSSNLRASDETNSSPESAKPPSGYPQ